MTAEEAIRAAEGYFVARRLQECEGICRAVLAAVPWDSEAMHLLGLVANARGQAVAAIDLVQRAIAANSGVATYHCNMAMLLIAGGQLEEAIASSETALALDPANSAAWDRLGSALRLAGRPQEALAAYRRSIAINPNSADARNNLGSILAQLGQAEEATAEYRRALTLQPDFPKAAANLANVLSKTGKLGETLQILRRTVALFPRNVEAHLCFGNALHLAGELDEAAAAYRQAIGLRPDYAEAFHGLARVMQDAGRIEEAVPYYREAIRLQPELLPAYSAMLFALHFHPGFDAAAILREHETFNAIHAVPLRALAAPRTNDRSADRRLRIGYFCPDFRDHCSSFFTVPLLSSHDHERFEIFCYADVSRPDNLTERLRGYADAWRSVVGMSDRAVSELISEDRIDILVDLTMRMAGGRPMMFARKPAPVQVAWLAYPSTTGLWSMDYRLTDPYLDPPGERDAYYSEESIRLPDSFWCYHPLDTEPSVNALPAAANGEITFGCLNNFSKTNDALLETWGATMRAVPGSRLLLLAERGSHRQRTLDIFSRHGVNPSRIGFADRRPRRQYLELYHRIDIMLDTFPYNGHTTGLDSLWMGVPIVTRSGQTAVARGGLCYLSNLGLSELASASAEEYVKIAVGLAKDLPRLKELRSTLRAKMEGSPLMDRRRFAGNVENAYRLMWRKWRES